MARGICWIESIEYEEADGDLKAIYDSVRGPSGKVDNLYKAYGLRPQSILPADDLYRAVLHHPANGLPKWLLELVGSYVAILCGCDYAYTHHADNFAYLLGDRERARAILQALRDDRLADAGGQREAAILGYVAKLTRTPGDMAQADIRALRRAGLQDGEILEVNQVAAMFAYSVRVINGLGIRLDGEKIGYYS